MFTFAALLLCICIVLFASITAQWSVWDRQAASRLIDIDRAVDLLVRESEGPIQLSFYGGERHYRQLEAHRAALHAPAPVMAETPPVAAAALLKTDSVPEPALGSTYWADFMGPGRLGHYDQKPILTAWPAGGLPQVWKQPVGGGYASFTVANGLAFTIEQRRGNEVVAAYDLQTGRERWTHSWKARFEEI